ncbi:MAG: zinc transport system substrate-binding [Geobacteraceae bacterium]|nr:MAG: zinc transport system substrate-binding [Geobacteraceae bacterium]
MIQRLLVRTLLVLMLLQVATSCRQSRTEPGGAKKVGVATTLFPLYDFTRAVAGDRAEVSLILPPGVEPHSFEPKPEDIVRINRAGLFVFSSKYMEPWAEDILKGVDKGRVLAVEAGAGVTFLPAAEHGGEEEKGHRHAEGMDPHIWLSIPNARKMVDNIAAGLAQKDPASKDYYLKNAAAFNARLTELDGKFKAGLADCRTRVFLHGGHFAFGYLAERYGLKYISAYAVSADAEPTLRKMVALINQMRSNHLKYIFYEELISPTVAETIARETGASLLKLHGIHNVSKEDMDRGVTYISLMEQNLTNLRTGLECR